MTYGKRRLFGFHVERATGSDGRWYLTGIVWVPRDTSWRRLRYFYPNWPWALPAWLEPRRS